MYCHISLDLLTCHGLDKYVIEFFVQLLQCFYIRKAVVGGMSSGAIGQFLASPTDLVKVQMQMEGRRILEGKPPKYVVMAI